MSVNEIITITYEDVENAANDLEKSGEKTTIAKIREKLGSGSYTTITRHLKTWQSKKDKEILVEMPDSLSESIKTMMCDVWKEAVKATHQKSTEEINLIEDEKRKKEELLEEAEKEIEKLETTIENIEKNTQKQTRELAELSQINVKMKFSSEKKEDEIENLRSKISKLEAENRNLLKENGRLEVKLEVANAQLPEQKKETNSPVTSPKNSSQDTVSNPNDDIAETLLANWDIEESVDTTNWKAVKNDEMDQDKKKPRTRAKRKTTSREK